MTIPRPMLLDALLDFFGPDAPIVSKAVENQNAAFDADRRAHGEAISQLERERDDKLPALRVAHEKTVAVRVKSEEKTAAARADEAAALRAKVSFTSTTDSKLALHRHALSESADPRIAESAAMIEKLQDDLRRAGYTTDTERRWVGLEERTVAVGSNVAAVKRRITACVAARHALEELAATYLASGDVEAALARIVASVGGFDIHTPTEPFAETRPLAGAA